MKRTNPFIILSLAAILLVFFPNDRTQAQNGPVGWATFGSGVSGGGNGAKIKVRNREQLLDAIQNSNTVIHISDTIVLKDGERIDVVSDNLTIEGLGPYGMIRNGGLILRGNNIIIRNLSIGDSYRPGHWDGKGDPGTDAITVYGRNIWIDHCELFHGFDGLLDVSSMSEALTGDLITVSWTKFSNHNKVMLIGSNDHCTDCRGKLRVTVHHCWFDGASVFYDSVDGKTHRIQQRMPRVRYGDVHVFNNYYEDVADYGIAARFESAVYVERNYFRNLRDPHIISDQGKGIRMPELSAVGNTYDNVKGERSTNGDAFQPGDFYQYSPDAPMLLPGLVMNGAGKFNRTVNDNPVAEPDHFSGEPGKELRLPLLENDSDPDGDSIRIVMVQVPPELEVKVFSNHVLVKPSESGKYDLKYQIVDFQGGEAWSCASLLIE